MVPLSVYHNTTMCCGSANQRPGYFKRRVTAKCRVLPPIALSPRVLFNGVPATVVGISRLSRVTGRNNEFLFHVNADKRRSEFAHVSG